jgi:hypothetical protein
LPALPLEGVSCPDEYNGHLPGTDFSYDRIKQVYGPKEKTMFAKDDIFIYRNTKWEKFAFSVQCALFAGLIALIVVMSPAAQADVYVETDSGFALHVPTGWSFQAVPEGFNTAPFDSATNPFGMEGGRFPVYDLYLKGIGCDPEGGLVISPAVCPPQPKFIVPQGCYAVPQEVPEVEKCPSGELVISPNICNPDD